MIRALLSLCFLLGIGAVGYWTGAKVWKSPGITHEDLANVQPARMNPFVFVVYGKDDSAWCERTLRSIFEQEYDSYRLIVIDDGSMDDTSDKIRAFVEENRQEARTILIQNAVPMGFSASLKRAAEQCFDGEILFPISARDWLVHPGVLSLLNLGLQKKGTKALFISSIRYPDYTLVSMEDGVGSASFFRTLEVDESYLKALRKAKHSEKILDPLLFHNKTLPR